MVTVLAPVALTAALLAAVAGMWLFALSMGLTAFGCLANRRDMRRRGIDWNGPASYRELRQRRAEQRRAEAASRSRDAGTGRPGRS